MIAGDLPHGKHHRQDLRVDLDILRKQDTPALEICPGSCCSCKILLTKRGTEFLNDRVGKQRLGNEAVNACLDCFLQNIIPAVRRDDDDSRFVSDDLPDLPCRFDAVHVWHFQIDQDQIVRIRPRMTELDHLDRLFSGIRDLAGDADLFQNESGMFAGDRIIVDHKHAHFVRAKQCIMPGVNSVFRIPQRDSDREHRPLAFFTADIDPAVHHLHDALGNCQPQTGAAVFVGRRAILLTERIKDVRQIIRAHADASIRDGEADCGLSLKLRCTFYRQIHIAAFRCEFDRIAKDVDQHLLELHVIADIVVIDGALDMAVIMQSLVRALAAEHRVDLFQQFAEREFFIFQSQLSGFDAGHIQDIIDE